MIKNLISINNNLSILFNGVYYNYLYVKNKDLYLVRNDNKNIINMIKDIKFINIKTISLSYNCI